MVREAIKNLLAILLRVSGTSKEFDDAIFVFSHMRSRTTALSNVLLNSDEITGFGEAHVTYNRSISVQRLILALIKARSYNRSARYVFDKVLHSRYYKDPHRKLYSAKAIFLVRDPWQSIASIKELYTKLELREYQSYEDIAHYLIDSYNELTVLWDDFHSDNRISFHSDELVNSTDRVLGNISTFLDLDAALGNDYKVNNRVHKVGVGDPLYSTGRNRIEKIHERQPEERSAVPQYLADEVDRSYVQCCSALGLIP